MIFASLATQKCDVLGVDFDKVLGIAYTRPATVVHVTDMLATSNLVQVQAVPCPVLWLHWGTTHCTKSTEHIRELVVRHFMASVKEEAAPQMRGSVAISMFEDVVILLM
jgi:hypothetical protein